MTDVIHPAVDAWGRYFSPAHMHAEVIKQLSTKPWPLTLANTLQQILQYHEYNQWPEQCARQLAAFGEEG